MRTLKRHQHIFTTIRGHTVTSTIIPFGTEKLEAITVDSLAFLIDHTLSEIEQMTTTNRVDIQQRNGQAWIAVEAAMRLFHLRTPP